MNRRSIIAVLLSSLLLLRLSTVNAVFPESSYPWMKPGPNDKRSPCPALNSLANHGYIYRNGTNIPISLIAQAGERVYSMAESTLLDILSFGFQVSIKSGVSPEGEITLTLSDLYPHNILEHDASLARRDEYFEPMAQFSNDLLIQLLEINATSDSLTMENVVFASQQRIMDSRRKNPNASFTHTPLLPIQMADEKLFLMLAGNDANLRYITKAAVEEFFTYDRIPQGHMSRQDMGLEPVNLVDDDFVELRNEIASELNDTMRDHLATSNGILLGGYSIRSMQSTLVMIVLSLRLSLSWTKN